MPNAVQQRKEPKPDKASDEETGEADGVVRVAARRKSVIKGRKKPQGALSGTDFITALLLGGGVYVIFTWMTVTVDVLSTTVDQPLVQRFDEWLTLGEFEDMQSCLQGHPLISGENAGTSFNGTRGFMVKFNSDGVARFHKDKNFRCFVPYFESARLPDTNAFVMNLLITETSGAAKGEVAVKLHLDNTVGVDWTQFRMPPPKRFIAHQVDVLYMNVPKDMDGGELHVFDYNGNTPPAEKQHSVETFRPPDELISPVENTRIAFRGDAFHRVMGFDSPSGGQRMSVVLEQYKLQPSHYAASTRYTFENKMAGAPGGM